MMFVEMKNIKIDVMHFIVPCKIICILQEEKNEDEQKKDKVCEKNAVEEDTKVLDDEPKSVYY